MGDFSLCLFMFFSVLPIGSILAGAGESKERG